MNCICDVVRDLMIDGIPQTVFWVNSYFELLFEVGTICASKSKHELCLLTAG